MKKAYVFLATGFEEAEAIGTVDVLRRGGMHVVTVSMTGNLTVKGGHDIPVVADALFEDLSYADADVLVLPGGGPMLNDYEELKKEIVRHHDAGKPLAAICAAPLVFGGLGLLEGKRATCYPGFEDLSYADADVLVLPGGGPMLNDYEALKKEIVRHHEAGKPLAAICAAPLVFGGLGLLEGKRATCYPGFEEYLKGATVVNVPTVTDGSIITGRGPGLVFDFGLAILEHLEGLESAEQVAKDLLLR